MRAEGGSSTSASGAFNGRRVRGPEALTDARNRAKAQLAALPPALRALEAADAPYPVEIAPALVALAQEVDMATQATAQEPPHTVA